MSQESAIKRIFRNAGYLLGSQTVTWVMSLFLMIIVPRYFGDENFGIMHLSTSIWAIGLVLMNFGMTTTLTREAARTPEKIPVLFWSVVLVSAVMFVVSFIGIMTYVMLTQDDPVVWQVVMIGGLNIIGFYLNGLLQSVLNGLNRMGETSVGMILYHALNFILAVSLIALGVDLVTYLLVIVVAQVPAVMFLSYKLRQTHKLPFRVSIPTIRWIVIESYPNMLAMFFRSVYANLDVVLMVALLGAFDQIGWYSTADRLTGTSLFIPTALITALFPTFSKLYVENKEELGKLFRRSLNIMLIFSVPVGLGVLSLGTPAVLLIYGEEYRGAGPILSVMGIVIILLYLNTFLGSFFIATDRQRFVAILLFVGTVLTIPLDFVLLPWAQNQYGNGAIGGALAYIVTELVMLASSTWVLRKEVIRLENVIVGLKAITAGLVMLATVWQIRDLFIAIPIFTGAVVYMAVLLLIRGVPAEEMNLIRSTLFSVVNRVRRKTA